MRRVEPSRRRHVDLLRRRPLPDTATADLPEGRAVRRVEQLRALLRLVERGVISAGEFERQEGKAFRGPPTD